nr:unnamed protein product [Callosobruchus chinensis]
MLSNLPDAELVISASQLNLSKNASYLHASRSEFLHRVLEQQSETDGERCVGGGGGGGGGKRVYHSDGVREGGEVTAGEGEQCQCYGQRPLGSYLHSSHGIASRTPQVKILDKSKKFVFESIITVHPQPTASEVKNRKSHNNIQDDK